MRKTYQKAKSGALHFVIAIFIIGMVLLTPMMFWTPGEMNFAQR